MREEGSYLGLPLVEAERGLAEGDGGTVCSDRGLGGRVLMGTTTEPAAGAVPVTDATREPVWGGDGGEGRGCGCVIGPGTGWELSTFNMTYLSIQRSIY